MKLYVWTQVLCAWTDGVAFAFAESVERARELIHLSGLNTDNSTVMGKCMCEICSIEPEIYEGEIGFHLYGGG